MMKHFKKVLSILCAIALLATSMTLALAEETDAQPAAVPAAEEAAAPAEPAAAPEEAAPAQAEPTVEEAPVANAPAAETAPAENKEPAAAEEPTVIEAPANDTPAQAPAEQEEPKQEEPAQAPAEQEEHKQEEPAQAPAEQEEPQQEEPAQEEPAQEEPAQEEPAQEEPAQEEPAQEEPAQEEPAQEEPAQEEPAQDPSEEGQPDVSSDEDDDLEEIDDWGYVDPEVIEANVPEITDELKGLRSATLNVGSVLADTIDFGEELAVTLNASDASTVELKLYVAPGPAVNTKVEGKAVSFTPAHSDVPYLNLYTYELANASGRSFEIVLSSNDTVSFQLAAVEKLADEIIIEEEIPAQVEEIPTEEIPAEENIAEEIPAEENNAEEIPAEEIPAEGTPVEETPAEDIPADVTPAGETAETPVPSIQASVKTYDALKVGSSISDNLVAGQKAKLQVKCGKNPSVTLILKANPDDLAITMDGDAAQFTPAGDGTYTCDLENVAFRKFNIIIGAKQDLSFSLSAVAAANEVVEGEAEEAEEETAAAEEVKETEEETIIVEETEQAVEAAAETEEKAEVAAETEEKAEVAAETEETTEEAEISEEAIEGEAAEDVENNTEEETEEVEEIVEESSEETEEGTELVVLLNDEQLEELGFRKVQILNENGTDIYNNISDEGVVIDHLDLGAEIWIKDIEIEGWALVYTIEETEQYVKLAEIEKQMPTDEEMIKAGYIKAVACMYVGADIYASTDSTDAIDHIEYGDEIWIQLIDNSDRAIIYSVNNEMEERYINLVDLIATLKPDDIEDFPVRSVTVTSNLEGYEVVYYGMEEEFVASLSGFEEDDKYTIQWKYSTDDGESYIDIENANDLVFAYIIDEENANYRWKVMITLLPKE